MKHYLLAIPLLFLSSPAFAYVGPGPGLSMLGSAFTLLIGVVFALFMVVFYPIRLFLKKRKIKNKPEEQ